MDREFFFLLCKHGVPVCKEPAGDPVGCQYLAEYMVIAIQGFLRIEPCAGDPPGGIIDRQMKMPDLAVHPFIRRGIHLL